MRAKINILGMQVDDISHEQATNLILDWALEGRGKVIRVTNVHQCMEGLDDPAFGKSGNSADLTLVDSRILHWCSRILGKVSSGEVMHGAQIMNRLCQLAEQKNVNIGLYGGTTETLAALEEHLSTSFPALNVTYAWSPPFRALSEGEMTECARNINAARVQLLFVGIGCPRQEKWMLKQIEEVDCTMIGVGAAFDVLSGRISPSPPWVHRVGLEWLWRTIKEPRRLGSRNLRYNPRFLYHFALQLLGREYPASFP